MFELNGEEITLETLQGKAQEYGMDFDSYLEAMKGKGLTEKLGEETRETSWLRGEEGLIPDRFQPGVSRPDIQLRKEEAPEIEHISQKTLDEPTDLGALYGYEKELVAELKKIYPDFKFEEAGVGTNAIKITPITTDGESMNFYKNATAILGGKLQGISSAHLTRENIIEYIESNRSGDKDKTAGDVFRKSGLTPSEYPKIQTGETETKKIRLRTDPKDFATPLYREVETPIYEQADAKKTEELIADVSGEYRKLLREKADKGEKNILKNYSREVEIGDEKNIVDIAEQVRQNLEDRGIKFEDWNAFAGIGGEAYGAGLLGNILAEEAGEEEKKEGAGNVRDSDQVSEKTLEIIEEDIKKGYTTYELEKLELEDKKAIARNTIKKLKKDKQTDDVKNRIATEEAKIAGYEKERLAIAEKAKGEEGEKIKSQSFIDENSKWKHEQIQKYKNYSENYLNSIWRGIKTGDPELSNRDAWKKLYKAKALHLEKLWAEGELDTVEITLEAFDPHVGRAGRWENNLYSMLNEKGYLPENYKTGDKVNIPIKHMFDSGIYGENFRGWSSMGTSTNLDDENLDKLKQYEASVFRTKGELAGIHEMAYLNHSPEAYERNVHGLVTSAKAIITHFTDIPEYEADKIVGKGKGHTDDFILQKMQEVSHNYNQAVKEDAFVDDEGKKIKAPVHVWTDDQIEGFKKSYAEEIGEGVGHFVPMLMELGVYSAAGGTILRIPKIAAALNTMRSAGAWGKLGYHAILTMVEETKMAAAGFTPGTGAAFYGGGVATRGIGFTKRWKWLDPIWQKVIKAGPVGAASAQFAGVTALAYQDLMGNKDFKTVFDAMYGDLNQTAKDVLLETIVFGIVGGMHVKGVRMQGGKLRRGVDLMTTREKDLAIESIIAEQQKLIDQGEARKTWTKEEAAASLERGFGEGLYFYEGKPPGYELLTLKQQEKWDALDKGRKAIETQRDVEDMAWRLDPKNPEFEANAKKMIFDVAIKGIQTVVPEYEGFKVRYTTNPKDFTTPDAEAEFLPGSNTMLFNKNNYTPGKSLQEITHAALRAKFKQNPQFELNFKRNFAKKFGKFNFEKFKGTPLYESIAQSYGVPVYEVVDGKKQHKIDPKTGEKEYTFDGRLKDVKNLRSEEFLAWMVELLADPKIYRQTVAKNFWLESKMEFLDMYEETFGKRPKIRTVKQFVEMLGRMSQGARRGFDFSTKAGALAELDKMDFLGIQYEVNRNKIAEKADGYSSKELKETAIRKEREFDEKQKDRLFQQSNKKLDQILKDYYNIEGFGKMTKEQQAKAWNTLKPNDKLSIGYMLGEKWKEWAEWKADLNYANMGSLWTNKRNEFIEKITVGVEEGQNGLPYLLRSWKPEESKLTSYIYGNLPLRFGHTQRTIEGFGERQVGMEKAEDVPTPTPTSVKIVTTKIDKSTDPAEKSKGVKLKNYKFEVDGKKKKFGIDPINNIEFANEKAFIESKGGEFTFMQLIPKSEKATIKEIDKFLGITPGMTKAKKAKIMNDFIKGNKEIAYEMIWEPYTPDYKKIRMYESSKAALTFLKSFYEPIIDPKTGKPVKFTYAEMPPSLPKKTRASQPEKRKKMQASEEVLDKFVKLMTEARDNTVLESRHDILKKHWAGNINSQTIRELRNNPEAVKRISKTEQGRKNLARLEMEETLMKIKGPMDVALAAKKMKPVGATITLVNLFSKAFPELSLEKAREIFHMHALGNRSAKDSKYHEFIDGFTGYHDTFKDPKLAAAFAVAEIEGLEGKDKIGIFAREFNKLEMEDVVLNKGTKDEVTITGKEIKETIDLGANYITDGESIIVRTGTVGRRVDHSVEFAKHIPKDILKQLQSVMTEGQAKGFLQHILGLHQRVSFERQFNLAVFKELTKKRKNELAKELKDGKITKKAYEDAIRPKLIKFITDENGHYIGDRDFVNGYERSLENLGLTPNQAFEGLKIAFKSESQLRKGQKDINEAKTELEKSKLVDEVFNPIHNESREDIYFAVESAKQDYVHSAKTKEEFMSRLDWMYSIAKANSHLVQGARQTVPIKYRWIGEAPLTGDRIKLEHVKSSVVQSIQTANLIAAGKFKELGRETSSDFLGLTAPESLLSKLETSIDVRGGSINTSGLYRMALLHPEIVKKFQSVENPKRTLLDDIMEKVNKELFNGKLKEALKQEKLIEKSIDKKLQEVGLYSKDLSRGGKEKAIKAVDKALANGRKRKKETRGMSAWDFDDTLARTKSGVRYTLPNPSGKPQPGRKVIFMAGGPGAGKSNVIKQLGLKGQGFKIVNQDISLQWLAKNHGLPTDMRDFTSKQASKWSSLGWEARTIAKHKQMKFQGKGDGIIVDGTGASLKMMEQQVKEFRDKGYDAQMVFVETSKEVAIERNRIRKERSLRTGIVEKTWDSVMKNKEAFKELFGERFADVNTDKLKQNDPMPTKLVSKLDAFTKGYIKGRLDAGEYAHKGEGLEAQGAKFDFAEFDIIKEGERGPLFGKAMDRAKKFGLKDQFILTARPHAAKRPIYEFLKAQGLSIPLKNIITLESSSAEAKAMWMLEKFSEGYNDMYFADDAIQNVRAVKGVLGQLEIRSKVVQAKIQKEKSLNDVKDVERLDSPDTYGDIRASKRLRQVYEKTIAKHRPDLVKEGLVSKTVDDMFAFIDALSVPTDKKKKYEQVTTKWLATSSIKIKEDAYKIRQAVEIAEKYKEDIFSYRNPNEIIEKYAGKIKEKPINPKTVKEFSRGVVVNKKHGITEYNVADTKEGMQSTRDIVNSHWGKDSNPWCITQAKNGKLTEDAWLNWMAYRKTQQRIVFQDGKLLGFYANGQYWGRMDNATDYPVVSIKEGRVTRKVELVDIGMGKIEESARETQTVSKDKKTVVTEIFAESQDGYAEGTKIVENRVNGITVKSTRYSADGKLVEIVEFNKDGKGKASYHFFPDGRMSAVNTYGQPFGEMSVKDVIMKKGDLLGHEVEDGGVDYFGADILLNGKVTEVGFKAKAPFDLKNVIKTVDGKVRADLTKILKVDADARTVLPGKTPVKLSEALKPQVREGMQNLKPIKKVLNQLDIKSEVQQALASKNLNKDVNKIMEHSLGVDAKKRFTGAEAFARGKDIRRRRIIMPDANADMELLIEPLLGKGEQGMENRKWFEKNFFKPWERGINDLTTARQTILNDYKNLRKQNKDIIKSFDKAVEGTNFTVDQAMRVYIWNKNGFKIPDLAKTAETTLVEHVKNNPKLQAFADNVAVLTKIETGLRKPVTEWMAQTLASEVSSTGRTIDRAKYIGDWIEIKNEVFSKENLNKMESRLGTRWRGDIEDMFDRMETGRTRSLKMTEAGNQIMDYLNGAVGATMNLNMRSGVLQSISSVNFLNFSDNNVLMAGKAFANAPQYWKDFVHILNSDMLVQRREGLKINVNEAELAVVAAEGKNAYQRALAWTLKQGFIPTKIVDSFAIAAGGATFYRNRINTYKKKGFSQKEAESKAWLDFQSIAEKTQQSSRPDLLSRQQTSFEGRLILPFANTPIQMNRIMLKEILDISKGRYDGYFGEGSLTHKLSKITYFGAAQSIIFATLQSGLFALMFHGDDDDDFDHAIANKKIRTLNTVTDSFLRGMGVQGAVVAGFKNAILEFLHQQKKGNRADYSEVAEDLLNISPTIGMKVSHLDAAGNTYKWNRKEIHEKGFSLDNTKGIEAAAQTVQAITNWPTHRVVRKTENIQGALDEQNAAWQRFWMIGGWSGWDIGVEKLKAKKLQKPTKEQFAW